ncbi:MAG: hypothetical protein AB7O59_20510 [Pirellulales bacterium]
MDECAKPLPPRRVGYGWLVLIWLAAMIGVWFALRSSPVAQMYGIAAVACSFMILVLWRMTSTLSTAGPSGHFQFRLKTVLMWVVPYVALAAWIVAWTGPYEQDFLNANVKCGALVILTQIWVSAFMIRQTLNAARRQPPRPDATAPRFDGPD